ncbi:hypothetical protein LCGC14_2253290 [marine sediment metagenome]|uniref:Uncharacterized protein n=1 Tax=marine sediment metagenome TaxID=412755 RepID=A0A0F9D1Q0_9ZZZZ
MIIKLRVGWGNNASFSLCKHIQLQHISFDLGDPEYWQAVPIRCKACKKTFNIEVGVN